MHGASAARIRVGCQGVLVGIHYPDALVHLAPQYRHCFLGEFTGSDA